MLIVNSRKASTVSRTRTLMQPDTDTHADMSANADANSQSTFSRARKSLHFGFVFFPSITAYEVGSAHRLEHFSSLGDMPYYTRCHAQLNRTQTLVRSGICSCQTKAPKHSWTTTSQTTNSGCYVVGDYIYRQLDILFPVHITESGCTGERTLYRIAWPAELP